MTKPLKADDLKTNHQLKAKFVEETQLPTAYGTFQLKVYYDKQDREHLALCMGDLNNNHIPLVRLHSECLTGDVFSSLRCDCGEQLHVALQRIAEEKQGILIYLRQEGRGIGLTNKIKAYALQDKGLDTVEANLHLGFPADMRNYSVAVAILQQEGIKTVRLMTNNPRKITYLNNYGIEVIKRVPLQIPTRPENKKYIQTKIDKLGHIF